MLTKDINNLTKLEIKKKQSSFIIVGTRKWPEIRTWDYKREPENDSQDESKSRDEIADGGGKRWRGIDNACIPHYLWCTPALPIMHYISIHYEKVRKHNYILLLDYLVKIY